MNQAIYSIRGHLYNHRERICHFNYNHNVSGHNCVIQRRIHVAKFCACLRCGKWVNWLLTKFFVITYALFDSIASNSIYQECLMSMDNKVFYSIMCVYTRNIFDVLRVSLLSFSGKFIDAHRLQLAQC